MSSMRSKTSLLGAQRTTKKTPHVHVFGKPNTNYHGDSCGCETDKQLTLAIMEKSSKKLAGTINSRDYDDEDADRIDSLRDEEAKAVLRVKKNAFYGQGSRARIPKVKKKQTDQNASPFTVLEPIFLPPKSELLSSAVQPGAHQDQYRLVSYPTEKSRMDPDRVFYTTTSLTEGINFSRQPAWYFGHNNKTKPADSNMLVAANRYGFRGSRDIQQRHTEYYEPPSHTRTEHTPHYLMGNDFVDEWVPPIVAAKYGSVNNIETPKLWPENSEFVTGSAMKRGPSYPSYNRETTVGQPERPRTSTALNAVMNSADAAIATLTQSARKELSGEVKCLPLHCKTKFESEWNERVLKTANPTLRQTLRRALPPYEAHTLVDPSDTMRYSGSTALIVHVQTSEEIKFRMRMQRASSMVPYDLKWRLMMQMFKQLKGFVKKDVTASVLIKEVGNALRRQAKISNTPTSVTRLQFITALNRMHCFDVLTDKNHSAVFSVFDPLRHNCVRFAEVVLALGVFDHPLQTVAEKLAYLWELASEFGNDEPPIQLALTVLTCCCASDSERKKIELLFKSDLKPYLYKMAVERGGNSTHDTSAEVAEMFSESVPKNANSHRQYHNSAANLYPHNITDQYLTEDTFVEAVEACQRLSAAFDEQLSCRLRALYGKDARYEVVEEEEAQQRRDFSWILDNKRAAAAAFAAAAAANAGKSGSLLHPQHFVAQRHEELLKQYTTSKSGNLPQV